MAKIIDEVKADEQTPSLNPRDSVTWKNCKYVKGEAKGCPYYKDSITLAATKALMEEQQKQMFSQVRASIIREDRKQNYRDELEELLKFFDNKRVLLISDVARYTGHKSNWCKKTFHIDKEWGISIVALARLLS